MTQYDDNQIYEQEEASKNLALKKELQRQAKKKVIKEEAKSILNKIAVRFAAANCLSGFGIILLIILAVIIIFIIIAKCYNDPATCLIESLKKTLID